MTTYRNTTQAFRALLSKLRTDGANITVRDQMTLELKSELIEIMNPLERCIVIPGRGNNIFATIAETMWVLSGRNDIAYLEGYLKRAGDFSDDGTTWRAGYGPRLRGWNGTDQLAAVRKILGDDPNSRRAVISLYDPDRDITESNDIPCNNWLHFMVREGKLHLNVVARSTDLIWGFSAINAFEWSVLQEMMAHWLAVEVGEFRFFASSLHIYERHYEMLESIDTSAVRTVYDLPLSPARFATGWTEFDATLGEWMAAETAIRRGEEFALSDAVLRDPLLLKFIQMIDLYWTHKRGGRTDLLNDKLSRLAGSDLELAAREYLDRPSNSKILH